MDLRSILALVGMGVLGLGCGDPSDSPAVEAPAAEASEAGAPASVSAPAAAAPGARWPDRIVAERGRFIPEGVEYHPGKKRFLLGSLREGTVFLMDREGRLTPFVEDPELVSSVGIEVDEGRGRLLVASSDASVFTTGGPGQASLGVYDLSSGQRIARVDLAATIPDRTDETGFFANDVTVDDAGNAYVSDSRTGAIYRVTPGYEASLLHRFTPSAAFSPNGLVHHPAGYLLVAGGESLYKVPLGDPAAARSVSLPEPIPGGDGVVWTPDGRLAIVANRANRVVALSSTDDWASAQQVAAAPFDEMASTVAVVGDELFVVHPHFRDDDPPSVERVRLQ